MSQTILERLRTDEIVDIEIAEHKSHLYLYSYDDYVSYAMLTKPELQQLISELQELEKQMI